MTDPLAKIQEIHDESVRLGLGRVLPGAWSKRVVGYGFDKTVGGRTVLIDPFGDQVEILGAIAACSWWLREWCRTHDALMLNTPQALAEPQADTAYYIAWAEEILENHRSKTTETQA